MRKSILQPKWRNRGVSSLKRFERIKPFVAGKSVLDIGCAVGYLRPNWLHEQIASVAANVTGIDIDQSSVAAIAERYPSLSVQFGDARQFDLNRKFDVIHAGELIEHIDNFEGFLQSVKRHLKPNGILLLSTPNVECINHTIYNLTGGLQVNAEHVCWFCDKTLGALLVRNGWEVVEIAYHNQPTYGFRRVLRGMLQVLPKRLSHPTLFIQAKIKA